MSRLTDLYSLPEPFTGRDCPIMLYLYCDESGKSHQSDVVSLCGYTIDHLKHQPI